MVLRFLEIVGGKTVLGWKSFSGSKVMSMSQGWPNPNLRAVFMFFVLDFKFGTEKKPFLTVTEKLAGCVQSLSELKWQGLAWAVVDTDLVNVRLLWARQNTCYYCRCNWLVYYFRRLAHHSQVLTSLSQNNWQALENRCLRTLLGLVGNLFPFCLWLALKFSLMA